MKFLERLHTFMLEMEMSLADFFRDFPDGHLRGEGQVLVHDAVGEVVFVHAFEYEVEIVSVPAQAELLLFQISRRECVWWWILSRDGFIIS